MKVDVTPTRKCKCRKNGKGKEFAKSYFGALWFHAFWPTVFYCILIFKHAFFILDLVVSI